MYKSDATDVSAGNFIDLLRQRKAGLGLQAFHGFQGYSNLIVAKPDSPIKSFADLKGKKVGEFGPTFLDWLILRAAGKKAYGIDLQNDATLVQGAPPLLNQFLAKGDARCDASVQLAHLRPDPQGRAEAGRRHPRRDARRGLRPRRLLSPLAGDREMDEGAPRCGRAPFRHAG